MRGKYRTVFILPLGAKKDLTEYGWEFESKDTLDDSVKRKIVDGFRLIHQNDFESIEKYVGEGVEVLFFYNSSERLESIMLKLYEDKRVFLQDFWERNLMHLSEIFFPV